MEELRNKRILVTGATGFIGSHLTRRLVQLGGKVSIILRKNSDTSKISDILPYIDCHFADLRDFPNVKDVIHAIQPQKVFHLAAFTDVARTFSNIEEIVDTNIKGTANLLCSLEGINYDCFVNTGTCEEYGDNPAPFREDQLPNPVSPYSASKSAATLFCQFFHKIMGSPIATVRPFLSYGPYQDQNRFIPQAIIAALEDKPFQMTGGEQTRELNYVSDIVSGFIKASVTKIAIGEIINIGNGIEYQLKDVVRKIFSIIGNSSQPLIGALPYRPGEAWHFYCDNSKAKKLLHWKPEIDLDTGLKMTIEWYQKNMTLSRSSR